MPTFRLRQRQKHKVLEQCHRLRIASRFSLQDWIPGLQISGIHELNRSNVHLTSNATTGSQEQDNQSVTEENYHLQINRISIDAPTLKRMQNEQSDIGTIPYNETWYCEKNEIVVPNGTTNAVGQFSQTQIHPMQDSLWPEPTLLEQTEETRPQNMLPFDNESSHAPNMPVQENVVAVPTYNLLGQTSQSQGNPQQSQMQLRNVLKHNNPLVQNPSRSALVAQINLSPTQNKTVQPTGAAQFDFDTNTVVDGNRGTIMIPSLSSSGCPNTIEITHTITVKCVPLDAPVGASESNVVQMYDRGIWATNPTAPSSPLDLHSPATGGIDTVRPTLLPHSSSVNVPKPGQGYSSIDPSSVRSLVDKQRLLTQSSEFSRVSSQPTIVDEIGQYQPKHSARVIPKQDLSRVDSVFKKQPDLVSVKVEKPVEILNEEPNEDKVCYCCFRKRKRPKHPMIKNEEKIKVSSVEEAPCCEITCPAQNNPYLVALNEPRQSSALYMTTEEAIIPYSSAENLSLAQNEIQQDLALNQTEPTVIAPIEGNLPVVADADMKTEMIKSLKTVRFENNSDYTENIEEIQPPTVYITDKNVLAAPNDNQPDVPNPPKNTSVSPVSIDQLIATNELIESAPEDDSFSGDKRSSSVGCCGRSTANRSSSRSQNYRSKSPVGSFQSKAFDPAGFQKTTTSPAFAKTDLMLNQIPMESPCANSIYPGTQSPDEQETTTPYLSQPTAPLPIGSFVNPLGSMTPGSRNTLHSPYISCPYCAALSHRCFYVPYMPITCMQHYAASGICHICGSNMLNVASLRPCCLHAQNANRSESRNRCVFSACCRQNTENPMETYPMPSVACPCYVKN